MIFQGARKKTQPLKEQKYHQMNQMTHRKKKTIAQTNQRHLGMIQNHPRETTQAQKSPAKTESNRKTQTLRGQTTHPKNRIAFRMKTTTQKKPTRAKRQIVLMQTV